ncbi:MAG TPA: ribonuclease III [Candidatus Cybelea sp.]|nr:ribonuclease III [Candidatus Cybelea sp.]
MKADGGIERLAATLGHRFADLNLLRNALIHPSASAVSAIPDKDYERLEFLGDRVLGVLVAEHLYRRFPESDAGELALRLNALVRRESLARVAAAIDLGAHLKLSKSERASGGAAKPAILADACEAVIAALFLDGGLEAARRFIEERFGPLVADVASGVKDAKTTLQERAHSLGLGQPRYTVVDQEGPPHEPTFIVSVALTDGAAVMGRGRSKREAEQAAASALLAALPEGKARGRNG